MSYLQVNMANISYGDLRPRLGSLQRSHNPPS